MMKQTFYELKSLFIDTLEKLQGRNKRIFAAQIAINLGKGGQSLVAKEFKMARDTIRKARDRRKYLGPFQAPAEPAKDPQGETGR